MSRQAAALRTTAAAAAVPAAVDLHGAGQVGGALLALLAAKGIPVATVHRRRGIETSPIRAGRTVLVDATPPAIDGPAAEAWVALLERTLRGGTAVVTCNKAPLALAWRRLDDAAKAGGVPLAVTGTVGGGTPILPALRALGERRAIAGVDATLSGTLGVVVPAVKAGASLPEAIARAQARGFCEPDPRFDLDGTDAWVKSCILHNVLFPSERPLGLAHRGAPLDLTEADVRAFRSPAVVATIRPGRVELGLREWDGAAGASGIQVKALLASESLTLSGPGAGPQATAGALLADVEAVLAGRLPTGIA